MNDELISRQRLLKELKHHKELFCRNRIQFLGLSKNDKARVDEIDNCYAMVINAPSAQPEQRWIPCSERLPDSKEYVLVTDYGETNMGRRFCGRWWLDCCGDKLKDVTAWMPLPEPYKEDGE